MMLDARPGVLARYMASGRKTITGRQPKPGSLREFCFVARRIPDGSKKKDRMNPPARDALWAVNPAQDDRVAGHDGRLEAGGPAGGENDERHQHRHGIGLGAL